MRTEKEIYNLLKYIENSTRFSDQSKRFANYLLFWVLGVDFTDEDN